MNIAPWAIAELVLVTAHLADLELVIPVVWTTVMLWGMVFGFNVNRT